MNMIPFSFVPTREAGTTRLREFAPRMGRNYAALRNTDEGPSLRNNVSMLSPYLRFRMITEEDVLKTTFERFTWISAEKFIQEIFWRAYFKGYLESRPTIWQTYLSELHRLENTKGNPAYQAAINGKTFIACFDHWIEELVSTGYLHNHARMWFASIWIFTLKLPWQLGADFMYRHLIDGDPASNTLSWRWVGGLHTRGKTYLARADNIEKYTNHRFTPKGLSDIAIALEEPLLPGPASLPAASGQWPQGRYGLLITSEDLSLEGTTPTSVAIATAPVAKPGGIESNVSYEFRQAALRDATTRFSLTSEVHHLSVLSPEDVLQWCKEKDIVTVAVAYAPVGPEADLLGKIEARLAQHGIALLRVRRRYDSLTWPHASKGFFALKQKIPAILEKLGLQSLQEQLL